jgi:hypothetical protein
LQKEQWPLYLKEVMRILKPGTGWAQLAEVKGFPSCDDGSVPPDAAVLKVGSLISSIMAVW